MGWIKGTREIAKRAGVSNTAVLNYIKKFEKELIEQNILKKKYHGAKFTYVVNYERFREFLKRRNIYIK